MLLLGPIRFQDFIVREIDPCGNVVTLTTMEAPEAQVQTRWLKYCVVTSKKIAKMHKCIREFFESKLDSSTRGDRKRKFWPHQQQGDYCNFVLYKENKDTQVAIALIAKKLNIKPANISVAGNKDRRAITSQLASVYRIEASQLLSLNRYLRSIKVGNCSYKKNSIFLGNLSGNRFSIVLRYADVSTVTSCLERLDRLGFINYYGAQRFGTTNIPTYKVGRYANPNIKNATAALEKVSRHLRHTSVEGMLLAALKKGSKNNYAMIPRNMLNLYLHSYQSLLWNRLVSRRIQRFGIRPLPGDLIQSNSRLYAKLPENECARLYEEIFKEESLDPTTFADLRDQFHVRGGLRKVFVRPADLKYRFAMLEGRELAEPSGEKFLALIVEFSLPAGCYATMALRELCRIDMSKKAQSKRNDYS
ncbi:Pseudouridylate synthase 7-like protein [Trichuris trichiura]|uniref:Pseudouridylate synthase 7-like protein n=1 Tax=Trichuris trichiura TaxID=36087 RepID=A0A077ZAE4_TRITR|nr:Pseudouridylate synthase 7-like protein [Trichuris trichiura]